MLPGGEGVTLAEAASFDRRQFQKKLSAVTCQLPPLRVSRKEPGLEGALQHSTVLATRSESVKDAIRKVRTYWVI